MTHFVPICVPEPLTDAANHLIAALGESPADLLTWGHLPFTKAGTLYGTRWLLCPDNAEEALAQPISRPEWDTEELLDMTLVAQAQAALLFPAEEEAPMPAPDKIVFWCGGPSIDAAVEAWGLELVPQEEGLA
jgi:hypothetical protein